MDNLGEDDLDTIRKQRMADNRRRKEKTKEWLEKGHGEYTEIQTEKEFFDLMKGEERMICHFYRENWPCKVSIQSSPSYARPILVVKTHLSLYSNFGCVHSFG